MWRGAATLCIEIEIGCTSEAVIPLYYNIPDCIILKHFVYVSRKFLCANLLAISCISSFDYILITRRLFCDIFGCSAGKISVLL